MPDRPRYRRSPTRRRSCRAQREYRPHASYARSTTTFPNVSHAPFGITVASLPYGATSPGGEGRAMNPALRSGRRSRRLVGAGDVVLRDAVRIVRVLRLLTRI